MQREYERKMASIRDATAQKQADETKRQQQRKAAISRLQTATEVGLYHYIVHTSACIYKVQIFLPDFSHQSDSACLAQNTEVTAKCACRAKQQRRGWRPRGKSILQ